MNSGFQHLLLKSNPIPHYQGGSPIPHSLGIKAPVIGTHSKILKQPTQIIPKKEFPEFQKKKNRERMERQILLNYVNGRL